MTLEAELSEDLLPGQKGSELTAEMYKKVMQVLQREFKNNGVSV